MAQRRPKLRAQEFLRLTLVDFSAAQVEPCDAEIAEQRIFEKRAKQ
jgi:hypothetical protein